MGSPTRFGPTPNCLRGLHPVDPEIVPLRKGSRLADERTAQRTGLRPRLRDPLGRYYPPFLALQTERYAPWALALWTLVPTPAKAGRVRETTVNQMWKKHRLRRLTAQEVLQLGRVEPVTVAPGVVEAAPAPIRLRAPPLVGIQEPLRAAQRARADLLDERAARNGPPAPHRRRP